MTDENWHIPDPHTQPEFYADVPLKRLLAWVIDTIIVVVAVIIILPFTAFVGLFFFPLLMLIVGFFYRILTIAQGSATWGMRIMAIEFRTNRGMRFDGSMAFAHTALFTGCWIFFPAQLLSMALMAVSIRAQGLPDRVLDTVVINRRAAS